MKLFLLWFSNEDRDTEILFDIFLSETSAEKTKAELINGGYEEDELFIKPYTPKD